MAELSKVAALTVHLGTSSTQKPVIPEFVCSGDSPFANSGFFSYVTPQLVSDKTKPVTDDSDCF